MPEHPHDTWMRRCFELARRGAGHVAPNPLVGCAIVHEGRCIGEGWHRRLGEAHAEVNALNSVAATDRPLLRRSTLYVSLEPCAHTGRTPPCADRIISEGIPRVVLSNLDPNPLVAGQGIARMRRAGIEVVEGVLEAEGRELGRRFFTFLEKKRPYLILKCARSRDGYIGRPDRQVWLSGPMAQRLAHRWRSEEAAILVGTETARVDDPALTTRLWPGPSPRRIVLDRQGRLPATLRVFDGTAPTLLFGQHRPLPEHVAQRPWPANLPDLLSALHAEGLQSLIVEGGAKVLQAFWDEGLWDELRLFDCPLQLGSGVRAPNFEGLPAPCLREPIGEDILLIYRNLKASTSPT